MEQHLLQTTENMSGSCVYEHSATLHSETLWMIYIYLFNLQTLRFDICTKPYHDFDFILINHAALVLMQFYLYANNFYIPHLNGISSSQNKS